MFALRPITLAVSLVSLPINSPMAVALTTVSIATLVAALAEYKKSASAKSPEWVIIEITLPVPVATQ